MIFENFGLEWKAGQVNEVIPELRQYQLALNVMAQDKQSKHHEHPAS